jgi:hypothetical protein
MLSTVAKLFNAVLNERITEHLSKRNLIDAKQIGFKKGCRTTDHMFVLCTLIEKCNASSTKLYTCFVDLQKALTLWIT